MEKHEQYELKEIGAFWESVFILGDGYDVMEQARKHRWREIASWGKDGWDLGSWPYVIVFFRKNGESFEVATYCEGDVTIYACPTKEIREDITNEIALFYWQHNERSAPPGIDTYKTVDDVPEELKGPYSRRRSE